MQTNSCLSSLARNAIFLLAFLAFFPLKPASAAAGKLAAPNASGSIPAPRINTIGTTSSVSSKDMDPNAVVARFGELTVTVKEYHDALRMNAQFSPGMFRARGFSTAYTQSLLQSLLSTKAEAGQVKKLGAEKDPVYQGALRMLRAQAMAQSALAPQNPAKLSDEDLRRGYASMSEDQRRIRSDVNFKYIYFKTAGLNPAELAKKKAAARKALARIKKGEDFFAVQAEVSDAKGPGQGPILVTPNTRSYTPEVAQFLSKFKPGQVSDIYEDAQGLFIFRVDTPPAIPSFQDMMADPRQKARLSAYAQRGMTSGSAYQERIEALKKKYGVHDPYKLPPAAKALPADDTVLAQVKETRLTIGDLKGRLTIYGLQVTTQTVVEQAPKTLEWALLAQSLKDQKREQSFLQSTLWLRQVRVLNRQYLDRMTRDKVKEPTEEEVQAYYNEHKATFPKMTRMSVYRLLVAQAGPAPATPQAQAKAQGLVEKLKKGAKPEALAQEKESAGLRIELKSWKDVPMYDLRMQDAEMPPTFYTWQVGQPTGPVQVRGGYAIYGLTERQDNVMQSYAQLKEQLKGQLRQMRMSEQLNLIRGPIRDKMQINSALAVIPADIIKQAEEQAPMGMRNQPWMGPMGARGMNGQPWGPMGGPRGARTIKQRQPRPGLTE